MSDIILEFIDDERCVYYLKFSNRLSIFMSIAKSAVLFKLQRKVRYHHSQLFFEFGIPINSALSLNNIITSALHIVW